MQWLHVSSILIFKMGQFTIFEMAEGSVHANLTLLLKKIETTLHKMHFLGTIAGTEQYVDGSEWILCDDGSEGCGSRVKIHYRNPESTLCNVTFLDGALRGTTEVTFIDLLQPVGSNLQIVRFSKGDRVQVCDKGSKYDFQKGTIDSKVERGKELYVKLDGGNERLFTYTKYIRKLKSI